MGPWHDVAVSDPTDDGASPAPDPEPSPPPEPTGWSAAQPPPQEPPLGWGAAPPPTTPPVGWGSAPPPPPPGWDSGWTPVPEAARPGVIPLRPLGVGEILEGAWGVFRGHWRLLLPVSTLVAVLSALAAVPYTLLVTDALRPLLELDQQRATQAMVEAAFREATRSVELLGAALLLSSAVAMFGLVLLVGVVTVVTGDAVLGRPAPWGTVWPRVRRRLAALTGTALLVAAAYLVFAVAVVLLVALPYLAFGPGGLFLGAMLALAAIPAWVYVLVRWAVAAPAAVLERASPVAALRRSWLLLAGAWWRTFGLIVLLALIYGGLSTVISTPLSIVAQAGNPTFGTSSSIDPDLFLSLMLVSLLASLVTAALVYPFVATAIVLRYLDLRMRREDLADRLAETARGDVSR